MSLILSIILWILLGFATAYFAQQRGRDPTLWFFIGMLLGLIGLLILFILPSYSQEEKRGDEISITPTSVSTVPEDNSMMKKDTKIQEWYYLGRERTQEGPVSFNTLKEKWEHGDVSNETFVWCEGMEHWQTIAELDLLEKLRKKDC